MPIQIPQQNPVALQVNARAVDTFVQTAAPSGGGLAQSLASALKDIQPSIQEYLRSSKKGTTKALETADEAAARRAFLTATQDEIKAVREGKLYADKSPAFLKVFNDSDGRVTAGALSAEMQGEYDASGLANDLSPEADQKFEELLNGYAKRVAEALPQADAIDAAFPTVIQDIDRLRADRQKTVSAALLKRVEDNTATEVSNIISLGYQRAAKGELNPDGSQKVDYAAMVAGFNNLKNRLVTLRLADRPAATKALRDTVIDNALANADINLLESVKDWKWTDPVTGKAIDGPFSGNEGQKALADARLKITNRAFQLGEQLNTLADREKAKNVGAVLENAFGLLSRGQRLTNEQIATLGNDPRLGPDVATKLFGIYSSANSRITGDRTVRDYDDTPTLASIYADQILGRTTVAQDVDNLKRLRNGANVETFNRAIVSRVSRADSQNEFQRLSDVSNIAGSLLRDVTTYGAADGPFAKYVENQRQTITEASVDTYRAVERLLREKPQILEIPPNATPEQRAAQREAIREVEDLLVEKQKFWASRITSGSTAAAASPAKDVEDRRAKFGRPGGPKPE